MKSTDKQRYATTVISFRNQEYHQRKLHEIGARQMKAFEAGRDLREDDDLIRFAKSKRKQRDVIKNSRSTSFTFGSALDRA